MSDWISVKDRLPEKDVGVLVYTRNRFVSTLDHEDIDYLEKNGEFHRYNGNQYISHWMPLPPKPESEDGVKGDCLKEVNEGEWIVHYNDIFPVESTEECSICHAEQYINGNDDNYCPNCGAKMKQAEKG